MRDQQLRDIANEYIGYVPESYKIKDVDKVRLVTSILRLLELAAKKQKLDVTDIHREQALLYFYNYNASPLSGHIYYEFRTNEVGDIALLIGAKMSYYQLVASRSGINGGADEVEVRYNEETNNLYSATATVYSIDKVTRKRIATTETVYYDEVHRDTLLWNESPVSTISRTAYTSAMRKSPMNDGSLSGVYLDFEIDGMNAGKVAKGERTKPQIKKTKVTTRVKRDLKSGKLKATKVDKRFIPKS